MNVAATCLGQRLNSARRAAALAFCLIVAPGLALAAERRGGIEIGSKGVKMTVLEIGDDPAAPPKEIGTAIADTTIASGVAKTGKYAPAAIEETAAAAAGFAKTMTGKLGVAPGNILVIGSSGLPAASNRQDLVDAVKKATGLPAMEFISVEREIDLTIAGLVPKAEWATAALIDIGSGNTKGGLFGPDGRATHISVPLGSVTFADRVSKDAGGKPFAEAAEALRPSLLEAPLAEQVKAHPELASRKVVFLAGGAPYAMTTLMHPEAILQERVTITAAEIADYLKRLRAAQGLPTPDFAAIADTAVRAAAEKEYRNVGNKFKRENLIAGAELMGALVSTMGLEDKTLVFDRNSATAWLRAFLNPSIVLPSPPAPPPVPVQIAEREMPKKVEAPAAPEPANVPAPVVAVEKAPAPAVPAPKAPVEPVRPSSQSPHVPATPGPMG
jgi:Ppx/GppA phosphatase family